MRRGGSVAKKHIKSMLIWARFPIIEETEEFFIAAYVFPKKPCVSQIYLLIITRFLSTTNPPPNVLPANLLYPYCTNTPPPPVCNTSGGSHVHDEVPKSTTTTTTAAAVVGAFWLHSPIMTNSCHKKAH